MIAGNTKHIRENNMLLEQDRLKGPLAYYDFCTCFQTFFSIEPICNYF